MKRCDACSEEFESKFSFCPIDGHVLIEVSNPTEYEYRPTLIGERSLPQRLIIEAHFVFDSAKKTWPDFKADPVAFLLRELRYFSAALKRFVARPYVVRASLTAAAIISAVVMTVILFEGRHTHEAVVDSYEDEPVPTMIDFRSESDPNSKPGVGAGENGRVGFDRGRGEGSGSTPASAHGGGGSGNLAQLPPSRGRVPQPSEIPAPISITYARLKQALPEAGINIDPVLWKDLPFRDYGDPRSKSLVPSNGPGTGGSIGTGQGSGIGEGNGTGFGPGNRSNMGGGDPNTGCCGKAGSSGNGPDKDIDRVYPPLEVNVRARVLSKPEPQYTEEARRAQITGTVILSVVFSRTGQVTNILAVQRLCCGLTEKAIAAARQIRFVPASRDGQAVSTRMQLEYNFNLY
ncbi:MAG TPA: energy transducer TonB [Pyrinomonadaceae bacterium]|nr:energy transducer TonB [Pyrinomonadaceae bacterium]